MLPAAERRPLTILFCDIVDSTRLADRLAPEDLQSILDVFQDVCSEQFDRLGGYVADRPGDGVLAYFGFPRALEDDAERSLRCAMAIMQSMSVARNKPGIPISIRIGIASGRVIMANMRREQHGRRPVAVGRYVHLASRMQSLANAGQICVDDNTRRLVASALEFEDYGVHELRGFSKPEKVWQPKAHAQQPLRFVARDGLTLSPLVGRDDELASLCQTFDDVVESNGKTTIVVGDAGVGKSRLLHEFEEKTTHIDKYVFRYQCSPHFSNTALYPLTNFFERSAGIAASDSAQVRRTKLKEYVSIGVEDDVLIFALLCHRIGLLNTRDSADLASQSPHDSDDVQNQQTFKAPDEEDPQTAIEEQVAQWSARRRLQALTSGMVARTLLLAKSKPVLIVLEDAHWIDPTSLAAMVELTQRISNTRVMLLVTQRAPVAAVWADEEAADVLPLSLLNADDLELVIQATAQGRHMPRQVIAQILKSTDGVPLFVEEITREVLLSPSLHADGDRFVLRGALPELVVPDNLEKSLLARLDRAGDAKQTAQVGAVLGRDFSEELLLSVVEHTSAVEVREHIDMLVEVGVLVNLTDRAGHRYGFRHALLQDAAYASIPRERKIALHAKVAIVLEEQWQDLVQRRPELLATHLSAADKASVAVNWWQRAAVQARLSYANEEAITWLTRGLRELDQLEDSDDNQRLALDMQLELGDTLRVARGTSAPETRAAYAAAREVCESIGEVLPLSRALYGEFVTRFNNAALSSAGAIGRELLQLGRESDHLESIVCGHQAVGMHAFVVGEFLSARTQLEQSISYVGHAEFNAIDSQYPGNSQSYLCWTLYILGEDAQANRVLTESLKVARDHSPSRYALTLGNACYFYQFNQDADRVLATTEQVREVSEEHGLGTWGDVAQFFSCWAHFSKSPNQRTLGEFVSKISLWSDEEIEIPYFKCLIAEAYLRLNDNESAERYVAQAQALVEATGESWYSPEILRLQWMLTGRVHGWDSATTHLAYDEAIKVGRRQDAKAWLRRLIETSMTLGYTPQALESKSTIFTG